MVHSVNLRIPGLKRLIGLLGFLTETPAEASRRSGLIGLKLDTPRDAPVLNLRSRLLIRKPRPS